MKLHGRKVLITGADGFIGSHLAERLLEENCNVRALVYYNSFNSWGWLDSLPKDKLAEIEVIAGDVRDPNGMRTAIKDVDVVFHLAALIGIPFSYHSPDSYVATNITGTLNILQACRDFNVERAVITSTSEVYGSAQYVPIDERHPLQAQSPYSASKIGADHLSESFYRCFGTPVVIARPFNTYGPRQSARAVIPTIITQLLKGSREIHLGSLHPTRDMNYISDTCDGFIAIAKSEDAIGKAVNIGSGKEISIGDIAKLVMNLMNKDAVIISEDTRKRPAKSEVERLLCSNKLIKELTGWEPKISLKEGLEKTIEWFSSNFSFYEKGGYTI